MSRGKRKGKEEFLYFSMPLEAVDPSGKLKGDVSPSLGFIPRQTPRITPKMFLWLGSDAVANAA